MDILLSEGIVIPVLIFLARIIDVSIGTIRIIMVARDRRSTAAILGFIEVFIWILAISQIMQNLTNIWCYVGYSAGFAAGTYIGMTIERKLSIGTLLMRIVIDRGADELAEHFKKHSIKFTVLDAEGSQGDVKIFFTVSKRSKIKKYIRILREFNPKAFYTLEDVRMAEHPVDARPIPLWRLRALHPFSWFRKGK